MIRRVGSFLYSRPQVTAILAKFLLFIYLFSKLMAGVGIL